MAFSSVNLSHAFDLESVVAGDDACNGDLVWDLDQFKQQKLAQEFALQFENRICIYSASVAKIYTNYNVFFPKEENRQLVILPNPFAFHDIFQDVPEAAVRPTGLMIIPDYYSAQKQKMMLRIPLRQGSEPYRLIPLNKGLKFINSRRPPDQPLLPLLVKGDFRELDEGTPSLHLHSINLNKVGALSPMEIGGIRSVILAKMDSL